MIVSSQLNSLHGDFFATELSTRWLLLADISTGFVCTVAELST